MLHTTELVITAIECGKKYICGKLSSTSSFYYSSWMFLSAPDHIRRRCLPVSTSLHLVDFKTVSPFCARVGHVFLIRNKSTAIFLCRHNNWTCNCYNKRQIWLVDKYDQHADFMDYTVRHQQQHITITGVLGGVIGSAIGIAVFKIT